MTTVIITTEAMHDCDNGLSTIFQQM